MTNQESEALTRLSRAQRSRDAAKPRVLDMSDGRRGRLIGSSTSESGVIKTVRWDDGRITHEGDGNPDVVVLAE